jgi:hypothetical protein
MPTSSCDAKFDRTVSEGAGWADRFYLCDQRSMSEFSASSTNASISQFDFNLRTQLDALERRACTEDEFLREMLVFCESTPNFVSIVLAHIDARYRQGSLAEDLCRSIRARIACYELEDRAYGTTVELRPARASSSLATQSTAHIDTVRPGSLSRAENTDQSGANQNDRMVINAPPAARSPTQAERTAVRPLPQPLEVGCVLQNRYVLEGLLGRGGMGAVFKALDRHRIDLAEDKRHVAVKVLNENIGQRPEILADLRREFYCAQALSHPNIVKVYEMHHDDEVAFYTMELLEGELLSSVLLRTHPLPLGRAHAWTIIREVGAGLAHAHSRNVVHGDLKPQNVLLTDRGEVRVLDFGASSTSTRQAETSDPLQRNPFPAVTPAYTCCELLDGQQSDPRDDLYALACLSYELLAGKHPFQRLPSTEARDLGMRPRRPQGVSHRQWRSLRLGLSWYRESRSLSVRDWLAELGLKPMAELLPPPHALDAMLPRRLHPRAVPRVALLASLIAGLGLWVALRHASFADNVGGKPLAPQAMLSAPTGSQPAPVNQMTVYDARIVPQPTPAGLLGQPFLTELPTAPVAREPDPSSGSGAREQTVGASRTIAADKITISAGTYSVRSGAHFAEINVRRSDEARGNGSFVWWTEASSAKPGNDFVSQSQTTQAFSRGRHLARLFIRIVPNPSRTHAETFYVVIGQPSDGYFLGPITRAAILIPPLG